ncbi:hypothetical protein [Bacillus sp. EAC]|uniref:hypothetical protein n=1 Tax=Bacillus sp. EAC TaxID=1978338 RepID=UPI001C4E8367|nr:hypothetical protein [Bacillus sp. EAC]
MIIKIGFLSDSNGFSGTIGLSVIQEALIVILVYFLIKGFILLLETVLMIYKRQST